MDNRLIQLILAVACAGSAYFVIGYVLTRAQYKKLAESKVQLAYLAIEEGERSRRLSLRSRANARLRRAGWEGGAAPIIAAVGFLYAVVVLVMFALGLPEILGLVVGLPACVAVVQVIIRQIVYRRRLTFQRQLMPALSMLAAQIESGNGAERALEQILPSLEDPLGAELQRALRSTVTQELVPALATIGERYPSRAFSLFLAALEVDRIQGGSLAPALREASAMLERQFELVEEAQAELSQAKMEFFVVAGIIAMIAAFMLGQDNPTIRGAYTSTVGLVAVGTGAVLFVIGIWRAMRLLRSVKGVG
jgi:tight adherence protein B